MDIENTAINPEKEKHWIQQATHTPQAFEPLYQANVQKIYRYFFFKTGNREDAEDLTSQVFLHALEKLKQYRFESSFSGWLFGIARRRAADFYRRLYRKAGQKDPVPVEQILAGLDDRLEWVDLKQALAALNEDELEILQLRLGSEMTYREIAGLLACSEEAVRKRYTRLIERIHAQLA